MGDGQSDRQQLPYRLSKGLHNSHLASGDVRQRSVPSSAVCTACEEAIPEGAAIMWLDNLPYHVRCGRQETARRDAEIRERRLRRFGG
jgi:hypothetical protein